MNLIDLNAIQAIRRLQEGSSRDLLKTLVDIYIEQTPGAIEKMHQAFTTRDFDTLRREAHSTKASSATLGLSMMSEISRLIEDETSLSEFPSVDYIQDLLNSLDETVEPSIEELRRAA